MKFIKENPALAAGIGLPFLLVILFALASIIPKWLVAPPSYDLIFTIQDFSCKNGDGKANFDNIDGRIKAKYIYPKKENNYINCSDNQRIYRFFANIQNSREITFELPAKKEEMTDWNDFEITELKELRIDNNPVAPDGYTFSAGSNYYSSGFFLFGGGYSYRDTAAIYKDGRLVSIIPLEKDRYYYGNQIKFLGWVASDGEKK